MTILSYGFAEIEADILERNEENNILHFRHPLNGRWYESTDIILHDMQEYYEKKKFEIKKLVQNIKTDEELLDIVEKGVRVKKYDSFSK
jgi:hypothetical protein